MTPEEKHQAEQEANTRARRILEAIKEGGIGWCDEETFERVCTLALVSMEAWAFMRGNWLGDLIETYNLLDYGADDPEKTIRARMEAAIGTVCTKKGS